VDSEGKKRRGEKIPPFPEIITCHKKEYPMFREEVARIEALAERIA
jgi:hypothetical protein